MATRLAASSESIADALDQGDVCTAAGRADELLDQVIAAVQAKQIPAAFQEELTARANELVNSVNCPEPEPAPEEEKKEEKEEKEDKEEEPEPLPETEPPPPSEEPPGQEKKDE